MEIRYKEDIERFRRFLEEKKALRKYLKRCEVKKIEEITKLRTVSPMRFMACVFIWSDTIDGLKYWDLLDIAWKEYIGETLN